MVADGGAVRHVQQVQHLAAHGVLPLLGAVGEVPRDEHEANVLLRGKLVDLADGLLGVDVGVQLGAVVGRHALANVDVRHDHKGIVALGGGGNTRHHRSQ